MGQELSGKVAAITGAASGIGLECAKSLLREGVSVALIDRAEDSLRSLCSELGPEAFPLVVDLTNPASVATMMPQILERFGKLDIFHANAGSYIGGEVVGWRSGCLGPDAELEHQCGIPIRSGGIASYGGAKDRRYHHDQLDRRSGTRGLGADLHRVQACGAGLRPHSQASGRQSMAFASAR